MNCVSPEMISDFVDYDPETGQMTWRYPSGKWFKNSQSYSAWLTRCAGKPAFCLKRKDGYFWGSFLGKKLLAHRVAWCRHHGKWPDGVIDHIKPVSGQVSDNRIKNLRDTSQSHNQRNRSFQSNGSSIYPGVRKMPSGRYKVRIKVDQKERYLGTFDTETEAISVRKSAEREFGFLPGHAQQKNPAPLGCGVEVREECQQ